MSLLERALIFPVLFVLAWVSSVASVHEIVPGSRKRISSGALLVVVNLVLIGTFALLFRDYQTTHFFSAGIACLLTGLLYALPAAVLAWVVLRRGFAVNPAFAGMAAGTLAGLAGLGMLELHCPNFQLAHVLVWHIAVVLLSGAAGALMGLTRRLWASESN